MKKAIKHIQKALRALEKQLERDKGKSVFQKYDVIVAESTLRELMEEIGAQQ